MTFIKIIVEEKLNSFKNSNLKIQFHCFVGKPLILADVYKERFDWSPQEYVNLNESTDISRGFVFVTGFSANHFEYVLM